MLLLAITSAAIGSWDVHAAEEVALDKREAGIVAILEGEKSAENGVEAREKKLDAALRPLFQLCPSSAVVNTIFDSVDHVYIMCAGDTECQSARHRVLSWPTSAAKLTIFDGKQNDAKHFGIHAAEISYTIKATRAHHDVVAGAYAKGYKRVLVLESDVLFRSDVDAAEYGWNAGALAKLKHFIQSDKLMLLRLGYFNFPYSSMIEEDGAYGSLRAAGYRRCLPKCKCRMAVEDHVCEAAVGCDCRGGEAYVIDTSLHSKMPQRLITEAKQPDSGHKSKWTNYEIENIIDSKCETAQSAIDSTVRKSC